ncbi:hypothetical protein M885DRAFT_520603 [Pelagophyceae sp. CCMP2097]|nr:hypothetical protein M885DRAFT_520603 [Pelagophyceae sp. CCMP2097]
MSKRGADSVPVNPKDVLDWLAASLVGVTPDERDAVLANAQSLQLTGAQLAAMTEADVGSKLGVAKFGPRRKLFLRIQDLRSQTIVVEDDDAPDVSSAAAPPPAAASTASAASGAPPRRPRGAPAAAAPVSRASAASGVDDKAVDAQMNAEAACVGSCRWATGRLAKILKAPRDEAWAPKQLKNARLAELDELSSRACALPKMSCVVVGSTGAGKSTLLNALLGESEVLPTNGMRACTAVLIELAFLDDGNAPDYVGNVEFISRAEWDAEEEACFEELTQVDGRAILNVSDSKAHNHAAFSKLFAVYGEEYTHSSIVEVDEAGKKKKKNPMVADLRKKLRAVRGVTTCLGTTKRVSSDDARGFRRQLERYMDSSNDVSAGSYWPLVKKVRATSRKWTVLRSGAELIDAPGTADSNSARDAVVKKALKDADSVWIVSNINRAVNDKIAKQLLGESFRRTLLMDGSYGRLIFLATQADALQRSEVVRALGLPRDSSAAACASARNEYTRTSVTNDFYAGLEEMDRAAGDEPRSRLELEAKFKMPVYCLSSVDYQKLTGARDDEAGVEQDDDVSMAPQTTFADAAETEIPALSKFIHEATLGLRSKRVALSTRQLLAFAEALEAVVNSKPTDDEAAMRGAAREAYSAEAKPLPGRLAKALSTFDEEVFASLETDVVPRLAAGAAAAAAACVGTASQWGGTMHWATYKATLRRGGAWKIDMNEELAEPVFRAIATHWEKALVDRSHKGLAALKEKVSEAVDSFHDALALSLSAALPNLDAGRVSAARRANQGSAAVVADAALAAAQNHIQNQQKNLSRELTPVVAQQMAPAYQRGFDERGTGASLRVCGASPTRRRGSGLRRQGIVVDHVRANAKALFDGAVDPIIIGLSTLRADIKKLLTDACTARLLRDLELAYSVLWEPVSPKAREARDRMREPLNTAACEVRSALMRLVEAARSGGAPANEDDCPAIPRGDDDDDVMDVTAAVTAAAAQSAACAVIDLGDDDDDGDDGAPAPPPPPPNGPAVVKPENVTL